MHRGITVLLGLADTSAFPKEAFTNIKAPFTFPTKHLSELFCFIQSTNSGGKAFWTDGNRTVWNHSINAGVAKVEKRSIDEGHAQYTSRTRLLREYLIDVGTCVWVAKRKLLFDI